MPPVPTGGRRRVVEGTGGRVICGRYVEFSILHLEIYSNLGCAIYRFVPEGTEIYVPPYVLQRDPKNFSPRAEEFWPDRWLQKTNSGSLKEDPSFVLNAAALIPFSHGPGMCVAKNLARQEMKMLVCLVLTRYDVQTVEGFNKDEFLSSFREHFVMRPMIPLNVTFRPRESKLI